MRPIKPSLAYLNELRQRYTQAAKPERVKILNEFVQTTHYQRKYAIALLRGKRRWRDRSQPLRRTGRRRYTAEDRAAVLWLAEVFDHISSKRLRVAMNTELERLLQQKHLSVSPACAEHLRQISASTMDRLRRPAPCPRARTRGGTKPGTLLKAQIPVRTFAEWNDKRPGFFEIDLIQHDGGNARGFFACTLTMTDVATGWTELRAVLNKAQIHVFQALTERRAALPVDLLGLDSDNGAEFINDQLWRYCTQERITFTRSRAGRKNDNPFIEQKNWSVARRLVGYARYDTPKQVKQLNELYAVYRLYVNHFLPVEKLVDKTRIGTRIRRLFDQPCTPYQRLIDSPQVRECQKEKLRAEHAQLDVVQLKHQIDRLISRLAPSPMG
jgi:hypothetical protein